MKTHAFFRSRARSLPFALILLGVGSWAMSTEIRPATAPTTLAPVALATTGAILPYGAISQGSPSSPRAILPYGAISPSATSTPDTVLPYGAVPHDAVTASAMVLPYGAMVALAAP